MNKFLPKLFLAFFIAIISSCGGTKDEPQFEKKEVDVKLDFSLFQSGNMSRGAEAAYQLFYDNYIKTKKITPKGYDITFNNDDKVNVMSVSGLWGSSIIKLKEGSYTVTGQSHPVIVSSYDDLKYMSDSVYIKFDERVSVNKYTSEITLNASYDCFLLLFNAEYISSISADIRHNYSLSKLGNLYYMFASNDRHTSYSTTNYLTINITKTDNTKISLRVGGLGFEKGKYYYFDETSNSFNIPPMESGN